MCVLNWATTANSGVDGVRWSEVFLAEEERCVGPMPPASVDALLS